jgi:hypothetical protein
LDPVPRVQGAASFSLDVPIKALMVRAVWPLA